MSDKFPCAACGFLTMDEPPGSYDICPVCGWEDDEVQLRFPNMAGGANKKSLYEYQQQWFLKTSVCVREYEGYYRSSEWRALIEDDLTQNIPGTGRQYFDAVGEDFKPYWINDD